MLNFAAWVLPSLIVVLILMATAVTNDRKPAEWVQTTNPDGCAVKELTADGNVALCADGRVFHWESR